jgi:glycosyltransferase involved in cell wall biosynthesis
MCQAFSGCGFAVTLVTNNRQVEDVDKWIGFAPMFIHYRARFGLIFMRYSRLFFVINDIAFLFFARLKVNFNSFDYIYVRDEWLVLFLSFLVPNIKIIWESHEAKYNYPARYILKKGIKCVCISEGIYDFYLKQEVRATQMCIAHDAVDQSFFLTQLTKTEARNFLKLEQYKKIALYIGGLDTWKGVTTFCKASEELPTWLFVVVGGSPEEIAAYRKRFPSVRFLGQYPYKDLPSVQQAGDVLVIPNSAKGDVSAKYTSPLKLFAHMTSGIPILASRIPSLEAILTKDTAYFFEADNHDSLVLAIRSIEANDHHSQNKAYAAKVISQQYTWNNRAIRILRFINDRAHVDS